MAMTASARTDAFTFAPSALLSLKLCAFVLMLADHVDWLFLAGQGAHATVGRVVFPIFGAVLAYNMARTDAAKLLHTVAPRLAVLGVVSQVPYAVLQGAAVPLNILFTLAASVVVYAGAVGGSRWAALGVFVVAGLFVDYSWSGIAGVLFVALAMRERRASYVWPALVGFCALLVLSNGYAWAFFALPLIWLANALPAVDAPRMKWLFWIGYPLHLVVLAAWKLWA